ncbi:nucleoside/nucleotide kinase family protein [Nocardioides zeae]|uniref:Nucleoside/nucleotide kinase family protein n=1 Tax=Nocardioides imazamoxiresistens TaxID=3231893 RepID=A0ABU3PVV4_9ACTN|nr:nucleoside/nucleotide kinase family protein [Nocardioides zeae]MDT9593366.1 nucleoside/nucleotide kinase family protein [Nocardioides zeae]
MSTSAEPVEPVEPGASGSLDALVERAHALVARTPGRRAVLGVVGAPGAGKSTLVDRLLVALAARPPYGSGPDWVAHLPMDGYHLADAQLDRLGRRDRKGAPDTFDARGYAATLRRVRTEREHAVYVPGFERDLEQPLAAALAVLPGAGLVVTEGNYLLLGAGGDAAYVAQGWGEVGALLDETWFVAVPDHLRRQRLVGRHVRFGKSPAAAAAWVDEVDEPNARLVGAGRAHADLVLDPDRV